MTMEQYIKKSALIAELEKRLKYNGTRAELDRSAFMAGKEKEDEYILTFLDTLEVKEKDVDFEEEIDVCFRKKKMDTTVYLFVKKKIFQL